ncbi:PspC domain-containing protein [Zunongwangia sp.]|uniref:PspC domain-containing protein n=1 Tax=Zunongwangia sp. TaxID=1965325 RepID=UPI003AA9BE28
MNKTVNINLAGIFFHIDEDAFKKLQYYLDAIKRSLTNKEGQDEIIADIEARIAELFTEKRADTSKVISSKEVDEVIAIMGQPEDYRVDEDIFEDETTSASTTSKKSGTKKLYRDTENSYIGGVSSGLGHYLEIDAVWIRLIWIVLTFASSGGFLLIYIAFWIFTPEAKTTAEKLAMRGEEVTISNIEKKIREGFDSVSEKVKNVDYQKFSDKAKTSAKSAGNNFTRLVHTLLKIIIAFVGILLLIVSGLTIIGIFIGVFTIGTFGIIEAPGIDQISMNLYWAPLWLSTLLVFFLLIIPFFFLFILGLKILMEKPKSIGKPAKFTLLGIWILAFIGITIIGVGEISGRAFDEETVTTENLPITKTDTLFVAMKNNPQYSTSIDKRDDDLAIKFNENEEKILYGTDIRIVFKSTKDSLAKIEILKSAEGRDVKDARKRAENINYQYSMTKNNLYLNSYFTITDNLKIRDQELVVTVWLPEGTVLYIDKNIKEFHRNSYSWKDILQNGDEKHFLKVEEDQTTCLDCPTLKKENDFFEEEFKEESEDTITSEKNSKIDLTDDF